MGEPIKELLQDGRNCAGTLQYAEYTADDEYEKHYARRFLHAPGNSAEKADCTYGRRLILNLRA